MAYLLDIQLTLFAACFCAGSLGAIFLFRQSRDGRAWKIADLIWVMLGGVGAITAILAGTYLSNSSQLDRQIDLTRLAATTFDRDAGRFRLRYCETAIDPDTLALCEQVELISATTARNAKLPLFLQRSKTLSGPPTEARAALRHEDFRARQIMKEAEQLGLDDVLLIDLNPEKTKQLIASQRTKSPEISGDFQILNQAYNQLVVQVFALQEEWRRLRDQSAILSLQLLALCLISFAAPFRLGKSIVDLRQSRTR